MPAETKRKSNKVEKPEPKEVKKTPKSPSVENIPKSEVDQPASGSKRPNIEERKRSRPARHTLDKQAPNYSPESSPSKKDGKYEETVQVPFAPGSEVQVHKANDVTVEVSRGQRPFGKAVQIAKVNDDGSLDLKVDETGIYSLIAEEDGTWREIKVPVK